MNKVQKVAAGASLIGAVIGGGALTAMALPANAAVSATSSASPSTTATGWSNAVRETDLTGDTVTKVKAAALAANAGATVDSMTTEGDGSAAYEAHITKADGTHATVKLDANFKVTTTETGGPGGH